MRRLGIFFTLAAGMAFSSVAHAQENFIGTAPTVLAPSATPSIKSPVSKKSSPSSEITFKDIDSRNHIVVFSVTRPNGCEDDLLVPWNKANRDGIEEAALAQQNRLKDERYTASAPNSCVVEKTRKGDYKFKNSKIVTPATANMEAALTTAREVLSYYSQASLTADKR